jgi:hypothetical protein
VLSQYRFVHNRYDISKSTSGKNVNLSQPDAGVMEQTVQMTRMWFEEVQIYKMDPSELHILSTKMDCYGDRKSVV